AFFDHSRIIGCALLEYRWRIEISVLVLWSTPGTSGAQARASSNTPVNVVGDFLAMLSRDQWSGFSLGVKGAAHDDTLGTTHKLVNEPFVDGVLNYESVTGRAHQPRIQEPCV